MGNNLDHQKLSEFWLPPLISIARLEYIHIKSFGYELINHDFPQFLFLA